MGGGNMSAKKEIVGDIFQGLDRVAGRIFSGNSLRGQFAKQFPVISGKPAQVPESVLSRDIRNAGTTRVTMPEGLPHQIHAP